MFKVLKLGFALDLGYAGNLRALSEWWFDIYFGLGFGGGAMKSDKAFYSSYYETESPRYLTAGFGLYKRFYIGTLGLYAAPGADLLIHGISADLKDSSNYHITVGTLTLRPGVQLGYNLSPNLEVTGYLGWAVPLSSSAFPARRVCVSPLRGERFPEGGGHS
jgi:hypothetical protein